VETQQAVRALGVLAQDTRLAIFRHLVERAPDGAVPGALAEAFGLPGSTLSFHLKALSHADLIVVTQQGRYLHYAANLATIQDLIGYLTQNCCGGDATKCAPRSTPAKARTAAGKLPKPRAVAVRKSTRK
jgi:ArsR family transcriptional regulator, arsenate/arsenite/antimonite-responsive transcriptional repressor